MKLGYYPGCSLLATSREFDESMRAIARPLDIELEDIEDWACCGASSAHSTNHLLSIALPARTLAQAEKQSLDKVLAPCAACYNRLSSARYHMGEDAKLKSRIAGILDRPLANQVGVMSIAELLRDLAPKIREKITNPLKGHKVACYYGCLLLRPKEVTGFDDAEMPTSLETITKATGATPVDWNFRTECCGGAFSITEVGSVIRLGRSILDDAKAAGANAIVVACPLCHSNLDLRQKAISKRKEPPIDIPIIFVSQLVGLALGLNSQELGMNRHFANTQPFVERALLPESTATKSEGT